MRDQRRRPGTGPAAEARADKNHARIDKCLADFVGRFHRRLITKFGIAARAEAARDQAAELHFARRHRTGERLHFGIDRNEIAFFHSVEHDAIERVRAGATDAHDFDWDNFFFPFRQGVVVAELNHFVTLSIL